MKVFAVGNGCTWYARNNTSFIIDDKILFDTPSGSYKDVIRKIDIFKLDGIIISHFHADHFGDFPVFATTFMRESKEMGRIHNLKVYGPRSVLDKLIELNTVLFAAEDEKNRELLQRYIDFIDVDGGDRFELSGYKVSVVRVDHGGLMCLGYMFCDENGKTVGFSSDTKECDALHEMLKTSSVAFVDMASSKPIKTHLDTKRFMELQELYPDCEMIPVHMSDKNLIFAKENGLRVINDFDEIII